MTTTQARKALFESLFFDLDGTLVDSLPGIVFSLDQAFGKYGRVVPHNNLRALIGPPVRTIIEGLYGKASSSELDELETAFRTSYDTEGWAMTEAYPAVVETMQVLAHAGSRLFVFTNKPATITNEILCRLNIQNLFQEVVSKDSRMPPYPSKCEMLRYLIERHQIDASHSAVIGDSNEDRDAARANHQPFFFAGYGYGQLLPAELEQHTVVIANFSDLTTHCTGAA